MNEFALEKQSAPLEQAPEKTGNIELPDLLPEFCSYEDEGCGLADSCLRCPFPQCVYEKPAGRLKTIKKIRDREIVRVFKKEKASLSELAARFKLSKRTIQRALAAGGKENE